MTTYLEATDALYAIFNEAWTAGAAVIVGTVPEIRWHGVELREKPPVNKYWCRVSSQNILEEQATLNEVAEANKHRYTIAGLLFIQLFCPMSDPQAMDRGRKLAMLARDAYRSVDRDGVWFRNARINELAPEQDAYRFNVIVEYQYDDIG